MFRNKKSEFEQLIDAVKNPIEKENILCAFNAPNTALVWLKESGVKFTAADVIALAQQIKNELPK